MNAARGAPERDVSHRAAIVQITKLLDAGLLVAILVSDRVRRFTASEILAFVNGEASPTDNPKLPLTTEGPRGA